MRFLKAVVLVLALANTGYYLYAHGIAGPVSFTSANEGAAPLKLKVASPPPPLPKVPVRCVSVGPFVELADSNHAQSTLRSGGYLPRQRSAESEVADGMLVYLPMPTSAPAVLQLRKRLKTAGVADAPDVPGPGDAIVISLGAYSDQPHAQARINALRLQGFSPLSLERKRSGMVYWLDFDLKPTDTMPDPAELHAEAIHGPPLELVDCPQPPPAAEAAAASAASAVP